MHNYKLSGFEGMRCMQHTAGAVGALIVRNYKLSCGVPRLIALEQLRRSTVKTSLRLGYGASIVHAIAMTRNNDSFVSKLFLATKYKCRALSGVLLHRPRPSRAVEQSNRARLTYLPRSEPLSVVDAVVDLSEPELLEEGVLGLTHEHAHPPPTRVDVEQLHRGQAGMLLLLLLLGERGETGRGRGVEVGGGRGRGGGCYSASGGAQGGQERVTSRRGRRSGHGHAECRIGLRE